MAGLTASQVKSLRAPGRYGDGSGLYLNVAPGGSKNWILRISIDGKRRDMGLGGYPVISLRHAREKALETRSAVANGENPLADKEAAKEEARRPAVPTFGEASFEVHKLNTARLKNEKYCSNWLQRAEKYVYPTLGDLPLNGIDRLDVLNILNPIWTTKPETARRIRQILRSTFAWGMAHGYLETNPAGETISAALPSMPKVREHFRALHYSELPGALEIIGESKAGLTSKLALVFLALTAARSGEVRGAAWGEIDWQRRLWIIPASRMKAGAEHRVPLSEPSLAVLLQAWELREAGDYVFPSPMKANSGLSDMTLTKILRATGLADRMTVHGIRSSFRDWVAEETATPWAVAELALAHRVGTSVEQAYHRTDLLVKRRELMDLWGAFLSVN